MLKRELKIMKNVREENVEEPAEIELNESSTDDDVFVAERTASYNEAMNQESKNFVYDNNKDLETNILESKKYTNELMKQKHEEQIEDHHQNAVVLDERSDNLCSWIQIITACFSSFAHGSNDVANAIAPLATIYAIYKSNEIKDTAEVPVWVLLLEALVYLLVCLHGDIKLLTELEEN